VPKQVSRRDYIALTGLPDHLEGNNISYVLRPKTQALARHVDSIQADVYIVVAKEELLANLESILAKADKTSMPLPGSRCIHIVIVGFL
jgi:hypothetical protein